MAEQSQNPILSYAFAKEHGVVVLEDSDPASVGLKEGASPLALVETRRVLRRDFSLQRLNAAEFETHLSELYGGDGFETGNLHEELEDVETLDSLVGDLPQAADLLDTDDDAPVIRLINGVIAEAIKRKASDIHVEPYESKLTIRLRIDGVLQDVLNLSSRLSPVLVSRVKVMARLDIAEKRVPQDGRISLTIGGRAIDVRVSTLPSRHGERVVLRLLDKDQAHLNLDQLGMPAEVTGTFKSALAEPNGIILVTGPTGSGKTTTLYAGLTRLNDASRNILTVEDPIEYALDGVGQTQVNAKVGMTFAAGLRAILRQDPDVVMVGEIRDVETAEIAVQASLTGHLVLSTVHTNDAVSAFTRLRDMGVEPFLLASTVKGILAQRLVRRLCGACKRPVALDAAQKKLLGPAAKGIKTINEPVGCPKCNGTGYDGRIGLFELITVTDHLKRLIHEDASEQDLAAVAFKSAESLSSSGFRHVADGLTSIDEVLRVSRAEGGADGSL